ncbi:MAG: hypothetical protein UU87_C0005G0016 [Parcubacteria group bacterium GW2011_GWA2_42_11]|nr:MAG: hypothetical protein UU87_C0005G0016 [Parcubacteria group bacterium GW2011_GWA2_42_11]
MDKINTEEKKIKTRIISLVTKDLIFRLTTLALILLFLFHSRFPVSIQPVLAATLNPGSSFTVCTGQSAQPAYTTDGNPSITVYWSFSSTAGNTQVAYRVQIDNDPAFGSINVDSASVEIAAARSYSYTGTSIVFGTRYYWRLQITDDNMSTTDWISGDSFITNKPSLRLDGGIKLDGGVVLK